MGGPDTADLCAVDPDSAPSKAIFFQWQKQHPSLPSRKVGKIKSVDKRIARVQTAVDSCRIFAETAEHIIVYSALSLETNTSRYGA